MTFDILVAPEARVLQWLERATDGAESSLEFGAGIFTYTKASRAKRKAGIEWFEPYCQAAIEDPACDEINVYFGDMRKFELLTFDDFEVAVFIDSLEHINKHDGLQLLRQCQGRFKKIVIFVPVGPHWNRISDENVMQLHLSTWEPEDLQALGFAVSVDPNFHHTYPADKQAAMFAEWTRPDDQ